MNAQPEELGVGLRPLTARSVVLSILLGSHPPELPVRKIVRVAEGFDISDSALRVALTRMVAAGDLHRSGTNYKLSDRLVERQRRQDDAVHPPTMPWKGSWEMVVVTAVGRNATDRANLRSQLQGLRLGELREGFWLRPANLPRPWPAELDEWVERFSGVPDGDPYELACRLWDLDDWAAAASSLLERFTSSATPADGFTLATAIVRTLLNDPVLPDQLLTWRPWPADALRAAYREYQNGLVDLISSTQAL